nr:unnamed protein product [Digitaria exilis]
MASIHALLILPLAVLFALVAACAATTDPTACARGTMAIPVMPVPSCRIYTVSRACGLGGPYGPQDPSTVLKERCCRELAAVPVRCRCAALGFMMDGEIGRLQDFLGCSREVQRSFASGLTRAEECDLQTVDGGMCYQLAAGDHRGGSFVDVGRGMGMMAKPLHLFTKKLKQATMVSSARSSHTVLLSAAAVVLLSLLATASASTNWCEPGLVIPQNPLQSCRAYLVRRTCGPGRGAFVPLPVIRERCCRELEEVVPYCRCGALRIMVDAMPSGGEATSPCSWSAQLELASTLVSEAECNLMTIHGRPFCYALGAEGATSD